MKKFLSLAGGILLSSVLFLGCLSTSGVDYVGKSETMTPENSVVMIFVGSLSRDFDLIQINPEFEQNTEHLRYGTTYFTSPLEMGSCYIVKTILDDTVSVSGMPSMVGSMPITYLNYEPDNVFNASTKIIVSSKPGIQYYYSYYDLDAYREAGGLAIGKTYATLESLKESAMGRAMIVSQLKKCLKAYAGTAWEPVINAEMEEWRNAE